MADDSEPGHVVACAAAFLALCPLLVGIRFLTRLTQVPRKLGIDDWLTIPALVKRFLDPAHSVTLYADTRS